MQNAIKRTLKILTYSMLAGVAFITTFLFGGNGRDTFQKGNLVNDTKDSHGASNAYADVVSTQSDGGDGGYVFTDNGGGGATTGGDGGGGDGGSSSGGAG